MTPIVELEKVDFALDEMPGEEMHRVLHAYRTQNPVHRTTFLGMPAFVITGYHELRQAFRDVAAFPPHAMYKMAFEGAIGESFISMEDPGKHLLYRKLATPAFRSRAVQRYEREDLRRIAHELLDRLENRTEFDLVESFTTRFPYLVISRLLGLPRDREDEFQAWALALLKFRQDPNAAAEARERLTEFLSPVVEARRHQPRDDVISELLEARVDGRRLSDEEIYSHVRLLFPTGGETTHGSLGNLIYAVLGANDLWPVLHADFSLAKAAVDEVLRWETPIAVLPRLSGPNEIELAGVAIPPNSWVLFAIAAANRDPDVFTNPDHFDLDRPQEDVLTFGRGVKACPGMHLARKNLSVALEVLLERFPSLKLLDREAALPRQTVLRCPEALRVAP